MVWLQPESLRCIAKHVAHTVHALRPSFPTPHTCFPLPPSPLALTTQRYHCVATLFSPKQDKQAESLRERLVVRLQLGGPREWRLVAWCLNHLGYSEKGTKRVMEMTACYRHTLGEQQVGAGIGQS
jgi:hypothetical protein